MTAGAARPAPPAEPRQAGFTLVELLVVLAIAAAVAGVVSLSIAGTRDARIAGDAAVTIATALKQARLSAIRTGRVVRMAIEGNASVRLDPRVRISITDGRARLDGQGDRAVVTFLPDGRSSGGRIAVAAGDAVRIVTVNWLTGLVREAGDAASE